MSQGSYQVPTGGSESATTFAGQCNTAWLAVVSKNSGSAAPANGPNSAPTQFQSWFDNSNASFPILKLFDGVNWPKTGRLDIASSIWCPQRGGGMSTVSSASTTDIGAQPGGLVTITGVANINSFGLTAVAGEEKRVIAGGAFTLVNSVNMLCPGSTNIVATAGDIFTAIYEGAGVWAIYGYQRTSASAGTNLPTGAHFWMYQTGTLAGSVRANGNTIGNTGSGATEATGPAVSTLFTLIWNQSNASGDPEITFQDSSGNPVARGVSAAADFTTNLRRMKLPDLRGRVPVGLDQMGNTIGAAGNLTSTTMNPNGTTLGAIGGAQSVTLDASTIPAHNHSTGSSVTEKSGSEHSHYVNAGNPGGTYQWLINGAGGGLNYAAPGGTGITSNNASQTSTAIGGMAFTLTIGTVGTSGAHLNVQPSKAGTWYIAL